jgi:hypothetical protein
MYREIIIVIIITDSHNIHALLHDVFICPFFILSAYQALISSECCHLVVLCYIICSMPNVSSASACTSHRTHHLYHVFTVQLVPGHQRGSHSEPSCDSLTSSHQGYCIQGDYTFIEAFTATAFNEIFFGLTASSGGSSKLISQIPTTLSSGL